MVPGLETPNMQTPRRRLSLVAGIGLEVLYQPEELTTTKGGEEVTIPEHRLLRMDFLGNDINFYSSIVGESWAPGSDEDDLARIQEILERVPINGSELNIYDPDPAKPQVMERGQVLPYDGVWSSPLVPAPRRPPITVDKARCRVVGWGVGLDFGREGDVWMMPHIIIRLPVKKGGKIAYEAVKAFVYPPRHDDILIRKREFSIALPKMVNTVADLFSAFPLGSSAGYTLQKKKRRPFALLDPVEQSGRTQREART